MPLIKSISGIRGTIGSKKNENLTPEDIKSFTVAFGEWVKSKTSNTSIKIVVGRDARKSGEMINSIVNNNLISLGINVVDLGLSTTPTVEMMVLSEKAQGGIVITASHNPKEWNALKLLNDAGEFIDAKNGSKIIEFAQSEKFNYAEVDDLGRIKVDDSYFDKHIQATLNLNNIDKINIKKARFKVVVDGVNSSGGIIIPKLLENLNVEVVKIHCNPNGQFPHNPEPLKEHLGCLLYTSPSPRD